MSVTTSFRALLPSVSSSLGRVIHRAAQPAILLPVGDRLAGGLTRSPVLFAQGEGGTSQIGERGDHRRGEGDDWLFHSAFVAFRQGTDMRQTPSTLIQVRP